MAQYQTKSYSRVCFLKAMRRRSKITQRRSKVQTSMRATSQRTGLAHELINISALEQFRKDQERHRRQKEALDLQESFGFIQWYLKQSPLPFGPDFQWKEPVYRLMYGGASPLSTAGSLGAGGRFNSGMAQMSAQFPQLRAEACLYTSSTLECCYSEAQPPYGNPQEYQLTPDRVFLLWDLKKVLRHYADPTLEQRIQNSPLDATWSHQKVPMTSQLLAFELRQLGGDGIILPSTKCTQDLNIAFFFQSDNACERAFHCVKLRCQPSARIE